ncbi:aminopeptidase [Thermosipho atlanticus]|uniref:Aminopeptidase n=1 Tax=Thermosipho atlanticus DSM 15807 TaxID=1123380 RepID=A0A1M5S020_9BACT|nr:aminopeptidase [Thermosipho atlanticus]SHH31819.1 aminopeptidase [Thermosipho atlanticus DSM 15807]
MLKEYAEVALKIGVNLQKNQILFIKAPIDAREFVETITELAFDMGAYNVYIKWNDEIVNKIKLKKAPEDALKDIPEWEIKATEELINRKACFLSITGGDPDVLKDVPPKRIGIAQKARNNAMKEVSKRIMSNEISWCVVAYPTEKWALKVFNKNNTKEQLLEYILKASRIFGDPIKNWKEHIEKLQRITNFLNQMQFEFLHYEGPGTDLKVGLPKNHIWISGSQKNSDGVTFVPNIPTEEIFTAPHREQIEGIVRNSLPLVYAGNVIDKFELEFKNGKVVKYKAEIGEEVLKTILETDEGATSLGEVALVSVDSPIYQMKTIFYNTLFDENAASHFAFGRAYTSCIKNGEKMSEEELKNIGLNTSITHVDFMIGNENMRVTGFKNGEKITLMENGRWKI